MALLLFYFFLQMYCYFNNNPEQAFLEFRVAVVSYFAVETQMSQI